MVPGIRETTVCMWAPSNKCHIKRMSAITCGRPADPQTDSDYFLNGRYVVLQVENILFRVPTHAFTTQSELFDTMFSLPQVEEPDMEGGSERNPIKLPIDIQAKDFKNFLRLLYPLNSTVFTSLTLLSKEDWMSILKLATMWYFLEIRKVASQTLENLGMSSVEKIVLGREASVSKWVVEGYRELVVSENISNGDVGVIGSDTTIKLYRIREERLKRITTNGNPLSLVLLRTSVENAFKDELKDIRVVESGYTSRGMKCL